VRNWARLIWIRKSHRWTSHTAIYVGQDVTGLQVPSSVSQPLVHEARKGGRPVKSTPKEIKTIRALPKSAEISVTRIGRPLRYCPSTLYRTVLRPTA